MKRLPTDREILDDIYERYYETFAGFTEGDGSRSEKIYVPIDIDEIAEEFKIDGDIIFGRLYYHLQKKFGYQRKSGEHVYFFCLDSGGQATVLT
ncbi:hypothetical protein LCGC14_3046950, partial [marine sediment metagenome]